MDEPLKDDLAEARWKRLEAAVERLVKLVHEIIGEEKGDRCSRVA